MAFTVNDFRSKLKYAGARQNLFEVVMTFPLAAGLVPAGLFSFMSKAASLPPEQLGVITVPYWGRQIKVPGNRTFNPWNITVINDEDFAIRNAFQAWSNAINGHYGNLWNPSALNTTNYSTNATVNQYGKTGSIIKEYDLIGVWPASVSQIDLDWASNDLIEEFQVTLELQWWEDSTTS